MCRAFRIDGFADVFDDGFDFEGQGAAVGIAQHQKVGSAFNGSVQGFQSVVGVFLITVEKMLGIVDNFEIAVFQKIDAFPNHGEVFFQTVIHDLLDMQVPGFAENGDRRCFAGNQRVEVVIFIGPDFGFAGGTEGNQAGLLKINPFGKVEKLHVLGVRAGPATFDVMNPESIQPQCDIQFFIR